MRARSSPRVLMVSGAATAALLGVFAACQSPTQIILHIRTNVQCQREVPTPIVSVGRIDRPDDEAPLASTHIDCMSGGEVGTLVITPTTTEDRTATTGIRVALRYAKDLDPGRDTGDCTRASAAFCIVQRRIVEFRPHETLDLPIDLDVSCKGVYCSALETCNHAARCVSATCVDGTCAEVDQSGRPGTDGGLTDGLASNDGAIGDGSGGDGSGSDGSGNDGSGSDGGGDGGGNDGGKIVSACSECNTLTDTCCADFATQKVRCQQKPTDCNAQETMYSCWTKGPCQSGCCGTDNAAVGSPVMCRSPATCVTTVCTTASDCGGQLCSVNPIFAPTGTCP